MEFEYILANFTYLLSLHENPRHQWCQCLFDKVGIEKDGSFVINTLSNSFKLINTYEAEIISLYIMPNKQTENS